jgi:hypothetical protein
LLVVDSEPLNYLNFTIVASESTTGMEGERYWSAYFAAKGGGTLQELSTTLSKQTMR